MLHKKKDVSHQNPSKGLPSHWPKMQKLIDTSTTNFLFGFFLLFIDIKVPFLHLQPVSNIC